MDKALLERRMRNLERRNLENAEIGEAAGMSEDQRIFVEWICAFRHRMHVAGGEDALFLSESQESYEMAKSEDLVDEAHKLFPKLPRLFDFSLVFNAPNDYINSGASDEMREWMITRCERRLERINSQIEHWLSRVDKKYGTNYAPTGAWRLF